jgi:transposase
VEVAQNFPEECRYVLESLGSVYANDAAAREQKLCVQDRLQFHQQQSGPVMDGLHGCPCRVVPCVSMLPGGDGPLP